jgi:hypothetical protein
VSYWEAIVQIGRNCLEIEAPRFVQIISTQAQRFAATRLGAAHHSPKRNQLELRAREETPLCVV